MYIYLLDKTNWGLRVRTKQFTNQVKWEKLVAMFCWYHFTKNIRVFDHITDIFNWSHRYLFIQISVLVASCVSVQFITSLRFVKLPITSIQKTWQRATKRNCQQTLSKNCNRSSHALSHIVINKIKIAKSFAISHMGFERPVDDLDLVVLSRPFDAPALNVYICIIYVVNTVINVNAGI